MKLGVIFILGLGLLSACAGVRPRFHQVQAGETINEIAGSYGISAASLRRANSRVLKKGWVQGVKIYIPYEGQGARATIGRSPDSSSREPLAYTLNEARFHWPVAGTISSSFGPRHGKNHEGLDIAAPSGTPVKAARGGRVIYAGNKISGYGNMIIVRHSDTFATVYAHLSKMHVKTGQIVQRAATIGKVGMTGHATRPHLHFEVRNRRTPVDPLQYLTRQIASASYSQ